MKSFIVEFFKNVMYLFMFYFENFLNTIMKKNSEFHTKIPFYILNKNAIINLYISQ